MTVSAGTPATGQREAGSTRFVVIALLALLAVRLAAAALIELSPDEAYYLLWSRHLDWSYYDHPPMVAWWIRAGTTLFGDSPFGVRAVSVLSGIPTSLAVYWTGRALFDRAVGERAVLWLNATLLVGVGGMSATPDAPAVMFWTLAILAFALVVRHSRGVWWLAVGACAALGVASKLTDLFLGLGILVSLMVVRDLRRWLISPWTWAGGLVALAVFMPVLWWNAGHDWVTFAKQFRRVTPGVFDPLKFPEFVATQFALLNPLIAIFLGLATAAWIGRRRTYPVAGIGDLMWTAFPLLAYMSFHALHGQVQAHWLAPIFPTLAIIAAAAAETAPADRWGRLRTLAFPVGVALSLVGIVGAANPGAIIPYQMDAGQVNRGWDGVTADVERLRKTAGAEWIATSEYGIGAIVAYHLRKSGVPVVPVVGRVRYAFAPPPDAHLLGKPALFIVSDRSDSSFPACFTARTLVATIERKSGGETIETFMAYRATGASPTLLTGGC